MVSPNGFAIPLFLILPIRPGNLPYIMSPTSQITSQAAQAVILPWTVSRTDESAIRVRMEGISAGWHQDFLLLADAHWDNPHCDRSLLRRHLDEAVQKQAGILCFGDWFCAMQGKYDPRHTKTDVRPEHQGANYLDLLVSTATEFLQPYKPYLIGFGDGNHEWAIEKRLETSLIGRLTDSLGIQRLYEWGFVSFLFEGQDGNGKRSRKVLYYHHGSGGGGPVTKGVIRTNRRDSYIQSCDILVAGHIHEAWYVETPYVHLNLAGKVEIKPRFHLQLPTYKQEFVHAGYHVQNERPPKPLGGYWLRFSHDNRTHGRVKMGVSRAD